MAAMVRNRTTAVLALACVVVPSLLMDAAPFQPASAQKSAAGKASRSSARSAQSAARKVNQQLEEQAGREVKYWDRNNDGSISVDEFSTVIDELNKRKSLVEGDARALTDTDRVLLKKVNRQVENYGGDVEAAALDMIHTLDTDYDGQLDNHEWKQYKADGRLQEEIALQQKGVYHSHDEL